MNIVDFEKFGKQSRYGAVEFPHQLTLNMLAMNGISPWAVSARTHFAEPGKPLLVILASNFSFSVFQTEDSVWVKCGLSAEASMWVRAAFSPGGDFQIKATATSIDSIDLTLSSSIGVFVCSVRVLQKDTVPILHYHTMLTPSAELQVPFWPKDLLFINEKGETWEGTATIHASQYGTRTGFIYLTQTQPKSCSILYLQNLTSLSPYCDQTESSLGDSVGGTWPELGFSLPATKKPLKSGVSIPIADAYIIFSKELPKNDLEVTRLYLDLLADLYRFLPRPDTNYTEWPAILNKGLKDLKESPGCWSQVAGNSYLNAYVSDYDTPPEIMVQLAVLLPLLDYVEWSGDELEVMKTIKRGLDSFYDEELHTIMRWLPAAENRLKGEEEQKVPKVMDSWYLHHPLLNLSRLALKGDDVAKKLFLNSLEFAIKVARHFHYKWPVFYKMDTLEIVKAETAEGKGGEKDVAGIYCHVMLQAFELTKEKHYLVEAERAAKTLEGYGFDVFYQANNTAFAAGALLRLHKLTNKALYLDLSYMCLASIFRNTQLWDCNYGYGKNFPKFFAVYPLNDAPYTAAYEEQEVFCALHDYLKHAEGVDLLPSVRLLIAEFIRYLVDRAVYYYPAMLPKEMLEESPKMGEIATDLWIALEDLQDGWLKSGTVGQEVYGAGNAFGILPRHYLRVPEHHCMVYVDYPTAGFVPQKGKTLRFKLVGDSEMSCRMMLVKTTAAKIPDHRLTVNGTDDVLSGKKVKGGAIEYTLSGNSAVELKFI